jgi:hypothetical protein
LASKKNNFFSGRNLCIATKHGKEKVIAPLLEKHLGVTCFVAPNLNTDELGTFSGEVDRKLSPLETARAKCLMAMDVSKCDLAVSSEGTFGPHPIIGFIPSDHEIIFLFDKKNNVEIHESELSTETNFNSKEVKTFSELKSFAKSILFPSHALILKAPKNSIIHKDITSWKVLEEKVESLIQIEKSITAETDMRAHNNPSRMKVIQSCTEKLISTILQKCPSCHFPGFGITQKKSGLPCSLCGLPTRSILEHEYSCKKCSFKKIILFPNNKQMEDPMYCDYCNP